MKKRIIILIATLIILVLNISLFAAETKTKSTNEIRSKSIELNEDFNTSSIPPFKVTSKKPHKFAVVIGQDNYRNMSLDTSINDAKRMAYVMSSKMRIETQNIRLYLDNQAEKNIIRATLEKLAETARKHDSLFFYYSGHGIRINDPLTGKATSALYLTSGEKITSAELYKWISKIKANVVVVIDSCYSAGMMIDSKKLNPSQMLERKNAGNIYYLTSSGANQVSMTLPRYGFSRFTYYLQKSILNYFGDVNKDGKLSLYEVYKWASRKTVDYGKLHGDKHTPVINGTKPNDFILISI
jgi:hypothetical protein